MAAFHDPGPPAQKLDAPHPYRSPRIPGSERKGPLLTLLPCSCSPALCHPSPRLAWRANLAAALVVPLCSKVRATSLWRYLCSLDGVAELPSRSLHGLTEKGCPNLCLLLTGLPVTKLAAAPCGFSAFGGPLARVESKLPAALEAALEEAFCCALQNQAVEPALMSAWRVCL